MHAASQTSPVYYYRFSYDGSLNLVKRLLLLQFPGAVHGDELPYMFNLTIPDPLFTTDEAVTVRRQLVRLWTNFAKYR
jgi:bile salt-stimulated lipase